MGKIKLIALDMDGTLLNDEEVVTDYTKKVIARALGEGIHVVLSTGRPLKMCISYAKDLKLPSYIITSNGAEIFTAEEELIEQHIIDANLMEKLWEIGNQKGLHMWMIAEDFIYRDSSRPTDFNEHTWLKIGYGNLSEDDKLYVMEELHKFGPLEITNSSPYNIEVNQLGVNKAKAIQSVCKRLDLTMDEVLAVGDSLNDFEMLKKAGVGIAVANAQKTILEMADDVTASNNEDGVAKAIEHYALESQQEA